MTLEEISKDVNSLFDRVRILETKTEVQVQKDELILEKISNLTSFMEKHDEVEMTKYDKISERLANLSRLVYIGVGVTLFLQFIGIDNLSNFFNK